MTAGAGQILKGDFPELEVVVEGVRIVTGGAGDAVILEEGKLISVHPRGRERVNRLEPKGIKSTEDWFRYFDEFWDESLSSLKSVIERQEQEKSLNPVSNPKGSK